MYIKAVHIGLLILVILSSPFLGSTQVSDDDAITQEISRVFPPISLTPDEASDVKTLMDISPFYKPSWVKDYISVALTAIVDGQEITHTGPSHTLTAEQIDLINTADEGSEIQTAVVYLPDNTLSDNPAQEHIFVFTIDPPISAHHTEGYEALTAHLQRTVIDHLDPEVFEGYALAAITFTIDQEGHIRDAKIAESSSDTATDKVLLDAICHMTGWAPATYASGRSTDQEFVWIVGNRKSCKMNFFNTRRDLAEVGN